MNPEDHYAEANRLLNLARRPILSGAPIGFSTHEAVAALAQVYATLALYRPVPSRSPSTESETPA